MTQTKKRAQYDIMHPLFNAFEESDLTVTQRMILLGLFRYMNGEGVCYPSYKALEKTTGVAASTISRNLTKLVDKGWITYEQGNKANHQPNTYHLNITRLGIEDQPIKVVPIDGYLAPDGTKWTCAAEYFKSKMENG